MQHEKFINPEKNWEAFKENAKLPQTWFDSASDLDYSAQILIQFSSQNYSQRFLLQIHTNDYRVFIILISRNPDSYFPDREFRMKKKF